MENTITATPQAPTATAPQFELSDSAAARIVQLLQGEPAGTVFRISVNGGGCSGFSYMFDLDTKGVSDSDRVFKKSGATLAIDDVSISMLSGSMIDYTEDLSGAGFAIKNPNATAKCGCGNSFGI